jgi:phosphoribosylformylglycinamidine cyclo-ligase
MYAPGEYDLAGFAVGVVSRPRIVNGSRVRPGDVAVGLSSSGLHSNGYSLARKVLLERMNLGLGDTPPELAGKTVGEALLSPTRLYARHVQAMVADAAGVDVRAMSHITGGGLPGNLPRVLPDGMGLRMDRDWPRAGIFALIANGGPVDSVEMRRTFNYGIGFVFVVPASDVGSAMGVLSGLGEVPIVLGEVVVLPLDTPFEDRVVWPGPRA